MNTDNMESVTDVAMSMLGISHMAYIKPVTNGVEQGYAVCAADGTQLAVFSTAEAAYFTAKQHDLDPVQLH
jgi:hypothetical protein